MQDHPRHLLGREVPAPVRVDLLRQLRGSADKILPASQEGREERNDLLSRLPSLRPAVRHQLPHIFAAALELQLPVFDVPSHAGEFALPLPRRSSTSVKLESTAPLMAVVPGVRMEHHHLLFLPADGG